jgi:hypothetical protein
MGEIDHHSIYLYSPLSMIWYSEYDNIIFAMSEIYILNILDNISDCTSHISLGYILWEVKARRRKNCMSKQNNFFCRILIINCSTLQGLSTLHKLSWFQL